MATNQIGKPTQLLITRILSGSTLVSDVIADETNNWNGFPVSFQVNVTVAVQSHSDATTNTPFYYGANDIEVGDWLLQPSGKAYRISSIVLVEGDSAATIVIEDVDNYILLNDNTGSGSNYPDEEQDGICIELDSEGLPIIANVAQLSAALPDRGYWIDDIVGRFEATSKVGVSEIGINTSVDLNKSPNITEADGDSTGIAITYTPFSDSTVTVKVNGIEVNLGDGNKLSDCYFSSNEGLDAKPVIDIAAGDILYWNSSVAGFELDPTDDIDISYQKSNLD